MKVKFLVDFMGVETHEQLHLKDSVADFEEDTAEKLIHDGRAVSADDEDHPKVIVKRSRKRGDE
jgi:hypothetical protein